MDVARVEGCTTNELQVCCFCDAEVPVSNFPIRDDPILLSPAQPNRYLCDLCASTSAGAAQQYPNQFADVDTMQIINYGTNMILLHLGKFGEKPTLNPALEAGKASPEVVMSRNLCHRSDCPEPEDETVCPTCKLFCQKDWGR